MFNLWRDLGYVGGALIAGVLADVVGIRGAVTVVGVMTVLSGVLFAARFRESRPTGRH